MIPLKGENVNLDLRDSASRLSTLTASSGQQSTPLNFAVGAVFALLKAEALGYKSQDEVGRGLRIWEQAKQLCQQIAGEALLPTEGDWLAGYFFNDGVVRIAVAFEHLVRQETNRHGHETFSDMKQAAIEKEFCEDWIDSWWLLYEELNRIRHRNKEFVNGPLVTYEKAVTSLGHLTDALEWAHSRQPPQPHLPPT
jgi:hypothetical protein